MRGFQWAGGVALILVLGLMMLTSPAEANPKAVSLVNDMRAAKGRAALSYSKRLEAIAAKHAAYMRAQRRMSHTGAGGSTPGQRARAGGYNWCYISENVAVGPWDIKGVLNAWAASPGHAKNMFNKKAKEFAVAEAGNGYWVMVLARPGCRG